MTDIIRGEQTESIAYFCPSCHTPLDVAGASQLYDLNAISVTCEACGWNGKKTELAQSSFKHEFKSDDEIAQIMMTDLRNLIAKTAAASYGSFLLKWGFLDQPIQATQLGRYIMDIAKAVATSVIATRKTLVEEKARERSSTR